MQETGLSGGIIVSFESESESNSENDSESDSESGLTGGNIVSFGCESDHYLALWPRTILVTVEIQYVYLTLFFRLK